MGMLSRSRSLGRGEPQPKGLLSDTGDCALAFASATPLRRHRCGNHDVPDTPVSISEFHGDARI